MKPKLAIVTTHPIQYNAPWFRLLAERNNMDIKVFYTWSQTAGGNKYDPGFNKIIEWDIPLLEGYNFEFVENTSKEPGTKKFNGIVNPGLLERISQFAPDKILVSGWNFKSHLQCLRYFHSRIPVLFRGDSTLLDEKPGWKRMARRLALTWVFKKIGIALYTGEANKAYFLAHGLKETSLVFAPHAIDNDRFSPTVLIKEEAAAWRRQLNIASTEKIILFAGKFQHKKSPELLLQAFVRTKLPGFHLVLAGNGELEQTLKAQANGNPFIHFLDFQNQRLMPGVYGMADVFVLPSAGPGETWGLAINEAMAAAKAVLVSDKCGCAADLVEANVNGWIFPAGNLNAFCEKLLLVHKNQERLNEMGAEGFKKIRQYSFEKIVVAIESV